MSISNYHMILSELHRNYKLYLTGSHFFGTAHRDSDVDFFTDDSIDREFLKRLGFSKLTAYRSSDHDVNTAEVWRWIGSAYSQIDIQIQKNVDLKIKIQNLLLANHVYNPSKEIWNLMFAILNK